MSDSRIQQQATSGTYVDAHAPHAAAAVFVVLVLALALLPFVGMLWARTDSTTENRTLADPPSITNEDGTPNWNYLANAGDYFNDHFAYRNQAVTANAVVRAALLTSATDQVVVGTDGWLYYGGTLPDYLGQSAMTERQLAGVAHNVRLLQDYAQHYGAAFAFTLAPNKNSLYADSMPYYYLANGQPSNTQRLLPYLQQEGVAYVNLFQVLSEERKRVGFGYLQHDSHWDNRWALLAANQLLAAAGHQQVPVAADSALARVDFEGDLYSMLYPAGQQTEQNFYYEGYNDQPGFAGNNWEYVEGASVTDNTVKTTSHLSNAEGSLLMFRDSFGNALLPYAASMYRSATFSKLVPYNFAQVAQTKPSAVIVQRAERHLSYLVEQPPIMANPQCALPEDTQEVPAQIQVSTSGSYWLIQGQATDQLSPQTQLYVQAQLSDGRTVAFNPFWLSSTNEEGAVNDGGFAVYVPIQAVDLSSAEIRLLLSDCA